MESMKTALGVLVLLVLVDVSLGCCDKCKRTRKESYSSTKYDANPRCPSVIVTGRQNYKTSCGFLGWGRCTRYRMVYQKAKAFKRKTETLYRSTWTCKPNCRCPNDPW